MKNVGLNNRRQFLWDTVLPILLCVCFIASSMLFLVQMVAKNQEENIEYLYNAADQKKISVIKQVEGDIQTLEGLAMVLGRMEDISQESILPTLRDINDENAFHQMGVANPDGKAWFVDIDGRVYDRDLSELEFFQKALRGEDNISDIVVEESVEGGYINYYGVDIKNAVGETVGVLCAVHSAEVIRKIIDGPVISGQGYSNIVDSRGEYILRSVNAVAKDILPENKELVHKTVEDGGTGAFTIKDEDGREYMAAVVPLLENRWYLFSQVPQDVLRARYSRTMVGIMVIIIVACALFALFIFKQKITASRAQKMLMELAYWDPLTGLRNFDGLKLDAAPILEEDELSAYVLWYGDVKKFKFINDMLGYEEGDRILKLISEYLSRLEGKTCLSCRVSADNFAGIAKYTCEDQLTGVVEQLQEYLENAGIGNQALIELAIGFYRLCPGDDKTSFDILMNYANMAHRVAKETPGSHYAFYDSQIRQRQVEDAQLEADAQRALASGEFVVYMQPKVGIQQNNLLTGAEALVRWKSPEKGLIPPGRFIPLFEKSSRIVLLDRYMFEEICKWFSEYLAKGGRPLNIAVNVSKVGLLQKDFIEYYSMIKEKYQIPDGYLELEFTEGILLNDTEMFYSIVRRLKDCGFICSLDDFGSGYSSLNLLKELPIDVLKLDILFFRRSRDPMRGQTVVRNFLHMTRELGIKTIAEGVESVDSIGFLKDCGCDLIQGYVFARPMPLQEFDDLLRTQGTSPLVPKDA
ncbi:MAG: bifunctional diguanylate cyclase/phosphodiesterase [Blautia sp.]|jgi:diguanylate cyclase (GGDEF)-like protein